jgi:hypothetical protein
MLENRKVSFAFMNSTDICHQVNITVSPDERNVSLIIVHDRWDVQVEKFLSIAGEVCLFCTLFLRLSSFQWKRQLAWGGDQTFLILGPFYGFCLGEFRWFPIDLAFVILLVLFKVLNTLYLFRSVRFSFWCQNWWKDTFQRG